MFTDSELADFTTELQRMRTNVERIPPPNFQRELDEVTQELSQEKRLLFFQMGNELLVVLTLAHIFYILTFNKERAPNFNHLVGSKNLSRDVIQFARVNQLQVPFFKCKDAIFIRDQQYGNYRHYHVSNP